MLFVASLGSVPSFALELLKSGAARAQVPRWLEKILVRLDEADRVHTWYLGMCKAFACTFLPQFHQQGQGAATSLLSKKLTAVLLDKTARLK